MIVRLELDFNPSLKEEEYMRKHLGHMRSLKKITILDSYFLEFLQIASSENEDGLNEEEKKALVKKIITCILKDGNEKAFLTLVMPSISHLNKVLSSPIIEEISNTEPVIEKVVSVLQENKNEREKFVEGIWDLVLLSYLKINHVQKIAQVLIDNGDLSRLLKSNEDLCKLVELLPKSFCTLLIEEVIKGNHLSRLLKNNDDLCKIGELFPQSLSLLVIREVLKNEELRKKLIPSSVELYEIKKYFPFLVIRKKSISSPEQTKKESVPTEYENGIVRDSDSVLFFSNKDTDFIEGFKSNLLVCDNALHRKEEVPMDEINVSKHLPSSLS